jgi:uncharacterized protein YkwD
MRAVMVALALFATASGPCAAASPADPYAVELGRLINDYRAKNGLQPLALDASLSGLAHEHAARMAREGRLSHDGFQQRFAQARSPTCVENVGTDHSGKPETEFELWRHSPEHDRNLLDARIARMGIAIEGRYAAFFACR